MKRFASNVTRRKRGQGQRQRNTKSVSNYEAINAKINSNGGGEQQSKMPHAFWFLGVFPLVATGGLVYVRDDLRQELKEKIGWEWGFSKETVLFSICPN